MPAHRLAYLKLGIFCLRRPAPLQLGMLWAAVSEQAGAGRPHLCITAVE